MQRLACLAAVGAAAAAASALCVSSADASLAVCVDSVSGMISSLSPMGSVPWSTNATTALGDGAIAGAATVSQAPDGSIEIVRLWCFAAGGGAPVGGCATVTETLSPARTSVRWHVSVAGASAAPWSVPIVTSLSFGLAQSQSLKLWAPWDRGSVEGWSLDWTDPLQPSDVLSGGWWDGFYRLGNNRADPDFIVAPLATILSADANALDAGVSLHLAPTDIPMDTHLYLEGTVEGALSFARRHHRISSAARVDLDVDLVGHAADWRAALGWSVAAWPSFWEPHNPTSFDHAGTGSYSWWLGSLAQEPSYSNMSYKLNWDLSGRFFPYMGMFLPPVAPGVAWENDPEGTQPRANVTFESIGAWYRAMADAGFADVSYANVNEYGLNIVLPPPPPPARLPAAPAPPPAAVDAGYISRLFARVARLPGAGPQICEESWQNASACLAEAFPDAVVQLSWDEDGGAVRTGAYYSWQNAVVVDPGTESYHAFQLEQLARHIVYEDAFTGYIIDRSDWMDVSSFQRDDGVTFIPEAVNATGSGVGASLKVSYQRMVADLRALLDAGPAAQVALRASVTPALQPQHQPRAATMNGSGLMLMNIYGNGRLDMMAAYDGVFSEGSLISGAGLLTIASPAVLWTYDANECCRSDSWADFYFQRHILMAVSPMLPFPGNDHAIPFNATAAALYVRYAPMMAAVAPSVWALYAHIAAPLNVSGVTTPAKLNAFIAPLGDADSALLFPIVLGEAPAGVVHLNLTRISRAWPAAGRESAHPLVRARAAELRSGAAAAARGGGASARAAVAYSYVFEALWPGAGAAWARLAGPFTEDSMVVAVTLQRGAALVRARRIAAADAEEKMQGPPPLHRS